MANTVSAQTAPQTTSEYEAEFELLRVDIERLKLETKEIRDETGALLKSMGMQI